MYKGYLVLFTHGHNQPWVLSHLRCYTTEISARTAGLSLCPGGGSYMIVACPYHLSIEPQEDRCKQDISANG